MALFKDDKVSLNNKEAVVGCICSFSEKSFFMRLNNFLTVFKKVSQLFAP